MQSIACVLLCVLISNCFGELSIERKEKFLNGFVEYLNNLPNQPYSYEEGYILNAQKTGDANCYNIETLLLSRPANDLDKANYQKCYATIWDLDDNGISIQNNQHHCEDSDLVSQPNSNDDTKLEEVVIEETSTTTEANVGHEPVQLDNEIQMNTGITSGEQFIAVPRKKPGGACMGCSSHVNLEAPGVTELATLGVKHLNIHDQNVKHSLEAILDVERQVQVVNGVRYILTLVVGYEPCSATSEGCLDRKTCKISILEKSWMKLPDGSKYRAILSNNCTEEWLFGDEGEVITSENTEKKYDENKPSTNDPITNNPASVDEILKTVHNFDVQSQVHQEKEISDERIKKIQEEIVPYDHIYDTTTNIDDLTKPIQSSPENVHHVNNLDADNSISLKHPLYQESDSFLSEDRKKAIDDLLNFFDSAGFDSNQAKFSRIRRSYEHDLKVMALTEKIHKIKKNIKNAKYLYALAQDMIDYLNELDFEIKTRSLVEVIRAEEEFENHQHFFYIQARVVIPCDKADCEDNKGEMKICNGVIEAKEKETPQILNAFCYDDKQNHNKFSKAESIDVNDPVLKKLVHEALKKIERESLDFNAMKIQDIVQPTIQKSSGIHTKFTINLSFTNCNKTVPYVKRRNCTVIQSMDSSICDVNIHQRHWLKERKITYSCTTRAFDDRFSNKKDILSDPIRMQDPKILEMVQKALQYLESNSNRNNKQKIVEIKSVSTQLVGGLITEIEFVAGYTECSNEFQVDSKTCKLLENEALRKCKAEIWDRPWLSDGRQINVTCNDSFQEEMGISRTKRAIPGGQLEKNPDDPVYKQLAQESLQKYSQDKNIKGVLDVLKVEKVTEQVVAGTLTRINFKTKSDNGIEIFCKSKIWEKPWMNFKEINVTCEEVLKPLRKKRSADTGPLVGAPEGVNPNDSKYLHLARKSLKQYLDNNGVNDKFEVLKVNKVTEQVVAGTLTEIHFTVSLENNSDEIKCLSKVWEKPWLKFEEITVSCEESLKEKGLRKKRSADTGPLVGAPEGVNPKDSKYLHLARKSLKQYLDNNGVNDKFEVLNVNKVTEQVVAGTLTEIHFTVSSENIDDEIQCHSEVWEKPWEDFEEITVSCEKSLKEKGLRKKRSTVAYPLIGGPVLKDSKDIKYLNLAQKSLTQYLQNNQINDKFEIVEVNKVTIKIVAGTLTEIHFTVSPENNGDEIKCLSKVWEKSWLKFEEITVSCEESLKEKRLRKKRSLRGQLVTYNPNKAEYKKLAVKSLTHYLQVKKIKNLHEVTSVEHVSSQLVSGMIYNIDFIASPICPSNVNKNAVMCNKTDINKLYCNTKIWKKPWRKQESIDVDCNKDISEEDENDSRKKRSIIFGASTQNNVNNEKYKSLVEEAVKKYQQLSNTKYMHKIIEIHNVSEQIVSGVLTKLDFTISPTKCLMEDNSVDFDDCKLQSPENILRCQAQVWTRPWLQSSNEIEVNCNELTEKRLEKFDSKNYTGRTKRQIGPEDDIDEDTKYYYADRVVHHINERESTNNLQKLITIHAFESSINMGINMIRMFIEVGYTYCLKHEDEADLENCEELAGAFHRLCHVRLWPSPDDELDVQSLAVVCDDEKDFKSVTGLSITNLIKEAIKELEASPKIKNKMVHLGEPYIAPSLDSRNPTKLSFVVRTTNCSKYIDIEKNRFNCFIDSSRLPKSCNSYIWMIPNTKKIRKVTTKCDSPKLYRSRRSLSFDTKNTTADEKIIQNLVKESLDKLEMSSIHKYKQRLLQINSVTSKISKGRLTVIDFDVAYTTCLKFEWVENITDCEIIEHLPRRHCISQVSERLWIENGREISVSCEDDETPLESHIEYETADNGMVLANEALKHIEAKYPHPYKQKIVRVFSLEKQMVAGLHFRMKVEVGLTDCFALSLREDCKFVKNLGTNKFCRVNIWLRPWSEHPPHYRVTCDYQDANSHDLFFVIQAERLFNDFLTTYTPDYVNNKSEMVKRYNIFKDNIKRIHDLNIYERGTARYGVTRFADLSYDEFVTKYMGLKTSLRNENHIPMRKAEIPEVALPESFDWREYDAVTEVKDQGSCGSCWAFSVTGNIEGQYKVQSGELVSLSEQELVDCDKLDDGCNGGLPDNAYRAIEQLGGLELETDYPYEAENEKCSFNKTLSRVQISGAVNISSDETEMAKWLTQNGPISIGINANAMQFYVGGISHPWKILCNPTNLDHGVLIVGYGIKNYPLFNKRLPYWIIKNSWGKSWGEQGYYRVYRGDGTCGVNQMASSALI